MANLINDTTITLYDARALDELEFFHIKFETHVIYAEGVPCKTLRNVAGIRATGLSTDAPCAPLVASADGSK
jgi:hypothetical protein